MLTVHDNEVLTSVGPGTPMGELFRRYWQPIAGATELDENPVKRVRLLGEDLVLYRDGSGQLGLLGEFCPHRRTSLAIGFPADHGLRCAYHGWLYDETGQCTEQPVEPEESTYYQTIQTLAYPVKEVSGLVFAYLGPEPAPLLPRFEAFEIDNAVRSINVCAFPYNWLQRMENNLDPLHVEYLHGFLPRYVLERAGRDLRPYFEGRRNRTPMRKIRFDRYEHGIIKRRMFETGEEDDWQVGNRQIFPNITNTSGDGVGWYVPIDDQSYLDITLRVYRPGIPVPAQDEIPTYRTTFDDFFHRDSNEWRLDNVNAQDQAAFATQGVITDRSQEHLGASDKGISLYRRLIDESLERIAEG